MHGVVLPESIKVTTALALACLGLACLPQTLLSSLAWEREAILSGQWWRLWTGHLVHFGMPHALTNALVLLAAGSAIERNIGSARLLRRLVLASVAVSLLLLATMPGLNEYRGASSLTTMLVLAAGLALWRRAGCWRPFLLAGAAVFAAATVFQALGAGAGLSSLPQGVAVAWQAHLLGAACGIVAALSTRPEINVNFGKQNRRCGLPMRCKAASAPQCEHCKHEPTQQRAGYGSQKHIYFWAST